MRWPGLLIVLAACKFSPGQASSGDGGPDAANAEAGIDAPDAALDARETMDGPLPSVGCFGTFELVCLPELPVQAFNVASGTTVTIDTDNVDHCDTTAIGTTIDACVRVGTAITLDGSIRATGSRPLILLAPTGSITLNETSRIDVASHRAEGVRGAGGNHVGCTGAGNPMGPGGGYGGSYGGPGGNGGNGGLNGIGGQAVGAGNVPTKLQGGCPGGNGGNTSMGSPSRGDGGGTLDLIAVAITINGKINASGAGARGGASNALQLKGGGGGGSGGLIVLDAQTFTLNASGTVMANGGSGGEGNAGPVPGADGTDPNILMPGTSAPGAAGLGGGDGGGGATASSGGAGGSGGVGSGGGGAGGGTGFIVSKAQNNTIGGQRSPDVTLVQ